MLGAKSLANTLAETGKGGMQTGTLSKIRDTLETAGIVFLEADDRYGPGVRLRADSKQE